MGFPGGSDDKESACDAGDTKNQTQHTQCKIVTNTTLLSVALQAKKESVNFLSTTTRSILDTIKIKDSLEHQKARAGWETWAGRKNRHCLSDRAATPSSTKKGVVYLACLEEACCCRHL